MPTLGSWPPWKTCWRSITGRMIRIVPWSAWTRPRSNSSLRRGCRSQPSQGTPNAMIMSTNAEPAPANAGGTANLFMMFAPLEGWRHVEVTDRHSAVDYAQILKDLSDKRKRLVSPAFSDADRCAETGDLKALCKVELKAMLNGTVEIIGGRERRRRW